MATIRVPLTDVTLGEEEAQAAARVVRSGWVTMGAEVAAFEQEFADALGVRFAIAVTNGTAALHLAYLAAGLKDGDEFAVPALTFVATMNAGLYCRARPVLIDITSDDDLTLSVADLERKLSPRTRLVVAMAYGGYLPFMEGLVRLTASRGIALIEDACHGLLAANLDGQYLGTFGDAGCFSFFGNKNLAIGEGGMIVTDREELAQQMRLMRSHGMTTLTWDRHRGHATTYDVLAAGYNYRMDEVRAAIGREQLRKLPAGNERRAAAAAYLRAGLEALNIPGFKIPFTESYGTPAHHLFVVLLPPGADRADFRQQLQEQGIQTSIHYPPLHTFTHTRGLWSAEELHLPNLARVAERLVTLPMGATLTREQLDLVIESVAAALA